MFELNRPVAGFLGVVIVLVANRADSANLIARFAMEDTASPLVDTVSGLQAHARDAGQAYSVPGPPGFGNAVELTERGAWILSVDESAELRDLENDFTVAAWVYIDSNAMELKEVGVRRENRIMGDADDWDADGWSWAVYEDGSILFTKNGIIDAISVDSLFGLDEWAHVAVTVSIDDGLTYYVDGSEVDNITSFEDINPSPGNNGQDDFWGIGQANTPTNDQWFAGRLDEVRVYSDLLTPEEIQGLLMPEPATTALKAGDADMDFDFDQLDLVRVQVAAKYLTAQAATWGEGDWDGAPGGTQGNPPPGNGRFDQLDIIAALAAGAYLTGPYAAISTGGTAGDEQTSIVYNPMTGEVAVDAPASTELTSINIDSAAAVFIGEPSQNLGGSFDNDADNNIFKATFGSNFGSLSFGNVAQTGLPQDMVANDLTVIGSLAGGGDLGDVDLIYVPEPSAALLALLGGFGVITWHRRRKRRSDAAT